MFVCIFDCVTVPTYGAVINIYIPYLSLFNLQYISTVGAAEKLPLRVPFNKSTNTWFIHVNVQFLCRKIGNDFPSKIWSVSLL